MFYSTIRRLFLLFAGPMFRLRVLGREGVPAHGALIVVAPHRSWLDPPSVGAAFPRPVRFLIIRRVYDQWWLRWFYRGMGALPVEPGGSGSTASLREALRRLKRGEVVGVFPEGRVVPGGPLGELRPGAALLAVRTGASVVPVALHGTGEAWPKGQILPRPGRVVVRIGPPIVPPASDEPDAVPRLTETIRRALDAGLEPVATRGVDACPEPAKVGK